jgi:hypothetical protein
MGPQREMGERREERGEGRGEEVGLPHCCEQVL